MAVTIPITGKLFVNQQVGGLFAVQDVSICPGAVFYVGSNVTGATDSTGFGKAPNTPFATLDFAVAQCTDARGDTIYVLPSHTESSDTTNAELFDLDVSGVNVIGLGTGDQRPTFTLEEAGVTVVMGATSCAISGLRFVGNITDLVTIMEIEAAATGCTIDNCYFSDSGSALDALVMISVEADADRLRVIDNHFNGATGGEATECIALAGGSDGAVFARNLATGDWKTGGWLDASGAASLGLIVVDNIVVNQDASSGLCYTGHAGNTGLLARNMLAGNKANTEPITELTAMHVIENYMTDAVAATGIVSATKTAWT